MALKAGTMKHRVTMQRQSTTRDAVGQALDTWTTLGKAFCEIKPMSGREYLAASGEKADVTHKIRMRSRNDIALAPRDRIIYGTRTFEIEAVLDDMEAGREWNLIAKEARHTSG